MAHLNHREFDYELEILHKIGTLPGMEKFGAAADGADELSQAIIRSRKKFQQTAKLSRLLINTSRAEETRPEL
ncbi:hypothetical protein JW911_04360 [Candidatus Peregrinibacteria bacterium]|nr:hypothetical protein [Candidatus Peregrinibacteria bacterium]